MNIFYIHEYSVLLLIRYIIIDFHQCRFKLSVEMESSRDVTLMDSKPNPKQGLQGLIKEFNVHGIMNTSGLLKMASRFLQETQGICDSMNRPKTECIIIITFY